MNARPAKRRPLLWRKHHDDLAAFEARLGFHLGDLGSVLLDLLQKFKSDFLVSHFAAAEAQGDLDLVALFKEALYRLHLHAVVMGVDVGTNFYFLDFYDFLLLARFVGFFLRLIFIFAVIEDFAYGRLGAGRYLNEIEASLLGKAHGLLRAHDAHLLALFVDQKNFAGIYPLIHTRPAVTGPLFLDKRFAVYVSLSSS